jgi:hypothetical protein
MVTEMPECVPALLPYKGAGGQRYREVVSHDRQAGDADRSASDTKVIK